MQRHKILIYQNIGIKCIAQTQAAFKKNGALPIMCSLCAHHP